MTMIQCHSCWSYSTYKCMKSLLQSIGLFNRLIFLRLLPPVEPAGHRNIWMRRAQKPKNLFYPILPPDSFFWRWVAWCMMLVSWISKSDEVTSSITQSCLSFILLSLLWNLFSCYVAAEGCSQHLPVILVFFFLFPCPFFDTNLQNLMGVKRSQVFIGWFICKLMTGMILEMCVKKKCVE